MEVKKKKWVQNVKKIIKFIKTYCVKNKNILLISLPFILMHVFTFIMCLNIKYSFHNHIAPILFSLSWIVLFIGISINLKKTFGKIFYILITTIFTIIFVINTVYYSMMNNVFDLNLLKSINEGAPYALDALKTCSPIAYLAFIAVITSIIIGLKSFKSDPKTPHKNLLYVLAIAVILHLIAPLTLGRANKELTWSSWRNARNIYNSFNDTNKSIKISGFFEYEIRNFYLTFLKTSEQENAEDLEFLENAYTYKENAKNKYTGIFKDKNLIIVQLEGMDNWIVSKENTPTIYKMMNEGINFTNHFSFYNGGGSTFNSEFAINTGFVTPFSYTQNAYSFNKNDFSYSLANIFKANDYSVNAFHMNSGEYYSRTINYKTWGYDNYYGLKDEGTYSDSSYELDRELILNEHFNELMFPEDKKFVDYVITYSGHVPFTNTKGVCKKLYDLDNEDKETEFVEMTEEECVIRQNKETDYMMSLLLDTLKEKKLLDSTVILVITDHYLYTLEDKEIIAKYKPTDNNLINKTPFFIWSKNIKSATIKEVTSQLNVLPTILNLFGEKYNANNYIEEDALANNYRGIAFFSDYSWYDGNVYVDGGVVTNNKKIKLEDLENKNYKVSYLTKKNDLTLKYNYFKKIKSDES